ncbi:ligand-dependent nuclear receptor-interacting factor 1 [Enoplosus armatus]|uniref:ligand-dependent nuclear receptor-interacting factor 1 n=1 Tax=Enoplosus armatus TaxID=215367 RepID=UPI0039937EAA
MSGTGVFYQAMPAVGADGKNIMKLIPVQMVNGQFFKTQIMKPQTDPSPQKAVGINIASAPVQMVKTAALNPSTTEPIVRKQVSLVSALPNQVGLDLGSSLNKRPLQQQTVNLMARVPQMATPATNCGKSVRLPRQLPVTVKSPALPRGQYLQIPPNAQVRTVPASELPPGIKKQIFTSSAGSSPGSGSPSVVYVSPITTVNQIATPPSDSALHPLKLLSKTPSVTSHGSPSKVSKPHLKLIPKVSQRSNGPIKWVIEEEDSSTAPTPDPIQSPSLTSEILRAVAERENSSKHCDINPKPAPQSSQGKSGQGQENALVMCNGKVFFVAKKCSLSLEMGRSDSPTAATKSYELNKTTVPSSQKSFESAASQMRQDLRIITTDESDEVIDLCDDDAQDDSSQQAVSANMSAVTHLDEDNVIFVSYIPPKSESGSTQELILKTQMALVKETDQTDTSSTDSVTERRSLGGTTASDAGRKPGQSMLVSTVTRVCGSAVMNMHDSEGSNINSQQSTSTQQLESMDVDVATESPVGPSTSDSSSGTCSPIEEDTHKMESSVNPSTSWTSLSRQMDDPLLRQIFGITADVKICLQRIDEALQSENIRSVEDHQEPTSGLKDTELLLQDLHGPQETDSCNGLINVKRVSTNQVPTEQGLSADPAAPSPHTNIGPRKYSHFKLSTKPLSALKNMCHSGQSSLKGTSCDVETEPVISYVEPIDEDFLSANENDIPNSQDAAARPQTQTRVDLSTNSRVGRTRKRTMCPCCIPGAQGPAVKSKAVRKDVKTSGRISCLTAKNKQNCKTYEVPASDSLTSMDSVELKQHERIKRLKELLKEKEAALELMRNT